ncbi:putative polarized growth protein (Boi2) [Aspergillus undulatus]|uniref:putative polarized growth protein (Boi2) n=1 Tax=Aspergillus undulatus TaxID=1810928 RepID=UPI003CCE1AEE
MVLSSAPRAFSPGDILLVVHDFDARSEDELTLRKGEKIELVELDDGFGDGWYLGKDVKTATTGLFPGVYTTKAPNILVRPRTDGPEPDALKSDGPEQRTTAQEIPTPDAGDLVSTPVVDDSTPQASRHTSMTNLRGANAQSEMNPSLLAPTQQQQQNRSSSSPLPSSTKIAGDIAQSIRQTLDPNMNGQDSPVMNETLSVIDEHITDLSTPRHSVKPSADQKTINDSASEYSSHLDHRLSYINGHETDEEEGNQPSEEDVRRWSISETVKHLRQLEIEDKHCDIFEEQEITGDVLLDMNQDFIMMKEFDFGVMGRRLKTWHKIKAFQEDIKGFREQQSSTARGSVANFSTTSEERSASRAGQTGPLRPRVPNYRGSFSGTTQHPRLVSNNMQSESSSPITPQTPSVPFMDHTRRPSAASIREINHQRRHSSLDATPHSSPHIGTSHGKKASFDRGWTMSTSLAAQRATPRPGTSLGASSIGSQNANGVDSAVTDDLDRGYFSGPEVDSRASRRVLQKRGSVAGSAHSMQSSHAEANRRHSRISSVDSIIDTPPNDLNAGTTYPIPTKGRLRSLSTRISSQQTPRSAGSKGSGGGIFSFGPKAGKPDSDSARSAPQSLQQFKNAGPKFRRAVGLRTSADTASKAVDTSVVPASPINDTDPASARTGSTTPSTSKSSERHSTDGSGKAGEAGISMPRARPSVKAGVKSKKDTSAYRRGLEKKSPQEQMDGCEYSGWMKKRSSNLMTTWKPRLFVLRGRRLSYYYSENDTEERGLIDITSHRVLRADNDPIIALHATITGATVSPTSPAGSIQTGNGSASENGSTSESKRGDKEGPFFFKLVPPKGNRTVQFTKPAVHYFQVDSVKDGRLWMAALMKATIDRDIQLPVETTNKQRTISLKEAQLTNQRPPALMTEAPASTEETLVEDVAVEDAAAEDAAEDEEVTGLMIQGLDINQVESPVDIGEPERPSNPSNPSNPLGDLDTGPSTLLPDTEFAFLHTLRQHLTPQSESTVDPEAAIFRLLVLADPQLEGDTSLPRPEYRLRSRLRRHWEDTLSSIQTAPSPFHPDVWRTIEDALRSLVNRDLPRAFAATRKRLDLLGNDYYLAHIYRTLHWWTRPTHVTVLGDLIGSQWVSDEEFAWRGERYWTRVFSGGKRVEDEITRMGEKGYASAEGGEGLDELPSPSSWAHRIINIVGNHDVGYSGDASERRIERFEEVFGHANWDIRFQHPPVKVDGAKGKKELTPTLHLINLNSLTLDGPPFSQDVQGHGYAYINDVISHRSYPVEDRTTFTLLLTHLPLHKADGVCVDGPYFTFFDADDADESQRFKAGGLREQNHLSEHVSTNGVLQGIFGMTGDDNAPGGGRGRNGLILTGHDHEGCDVVHAIHRTQSSETATDEGEGEDQQPWTWNATRYNPNLSPDSSQQPTPSIREITLRSMMGEYGGNAGLLSLWFDAHSAEWKYAVSMCSAGVQHIWWAVHVIDIVTAIVAVLYGLVSVGSLRMYYMGHWLGTGETGSISCS